MFLSFLRKSGSSMFILLAVSVFPGSNSVGDTESKNPAYGNDPGWQYFDPGWPAGPFARTPLKYEIQTPLAGNGKKPASPLAIVEVWPGGMETEQLQPFVMAADGSRRPIKVIWSLSDEPMRILFETGPALVSKKHPHKPQGRYYLYLGAPEKSVKPDALTSVHGFTLETKNFDKETAQSFDHNSPDSFVNLWNATPGFVGRSLVKHVQHGYHQHRGYTDTPLEYQAAMGAPLTLSRYTGYFEVEKADPAAIEKFEQEMETLRPELKALADELETHNLQVDEALKALSAAEESGDQNDARNKKTALTEWQRRRDILEKQTIPSKKSRMEYLAAAVSEIRHNTYTFLAGSQGASWALVDGRKVTGWPAGKKLPRRGHLHHGFQEGSVNLEPGLHRIEFLYAATGPDYLAFLLWRKPAQQQAVIMEAAGHSDISNARVLNAFLEGGAKPIAWKLNADSRIHGVPDFIWATFHIPGTATPGQDEELVYRWTFGDGGKAHGSAVEHLYLQAGRYETTVSAYTDENARTPLWKTTQLVHIHAPFDMKRYIRTDDMRRMIMEKKLNDYPAEHVLNALRAVEELDPERLAYNDWRRHAIQALSARPEKLAAISTEWAVRAGDICMCPTVSHYSGAQAFYQAAAQALPEDSPAWRSAMIKKARAGILAYGKGREAVETLLETRSDGRPGQEEIQLGDVRPRLQQEDCEQENFDWNMAWSEALITVGEIETAEAFIRAWRGIRNGEPAEQTIRQSALFRRIRSLIQRGGDADLLTAMEMLDKMLHESPEKLLSPEFNIMMLDMYLGREAYVTARHQAVRALNLNLNPVHRAEIMARHVIALCGLREIENAKRALEKLEAEYPYSEALRKARNKLERTAIYNQTD